MAKNDTIPMTATKLIEYLVEKMNGRATTWTATAADLIALPEELEELRIATKLPRGLCFGMEASFTTEGPSQAYRSKAHSVIGSSASYRYCRDGWRLLTYSTKTVYVGQKRELKLIVNEKQAEAIKARAVADLFVRKAA